MQKSEQQIIWSLNCCITVGGVQHPREVVCIEVTKNSDYKEVSEIQKARMRYGQTVNCWMN